MIETHPFGIFIPKKVQHLLLGSFPPRQSTKGPPYVGGYDWFYGTKQNHFWKILSIVYEIKLDDKRNKELLFEKIETALSDVIYQCERLEDNNDDSSLKNVVYNTHLISDFLKSHKIKTIYFSSKFAESKFRTHFKEIKNSHPEIKYITLPSPSPRYASMPFSEKVKRYKDLLPKLN